MTKTITITSGKGGVGKTNICVNLALQLSQSGYNTCLFDADLGLSNINILLGLYPEYTLENVLKGEKSIKDIIIRYTRGVDIVPGSTGVEFLADLPSDNLKHLLDASLQLTGYDYTLFDTAAGISKNVISFCMASSVVILVISPEPTSLTDGYSLLKVLSLKGFNKEVKIVVNRSNDKKMAELIFEKFHTAAKKFLHLQITYAGYIIEDECLLDSVNRQGAVVSLYPSSNASLCIRDIAKNLVENISDDKSSDKTDNVWSQYIELIEGPVKTQAIDKNDNLKSQIKTDTGINETPQQNPDDRELTTWDLNEEMPSNMEDDTKVSQEDHEINHENPKLNTVVNSINDLVETVSSISLEMGEIRRAIKIDDRDNLQPDVLEKNDDLNNPTFLVFDFKDYVKKRKIQQAMNKE
ncbi:MAG: MinD/ParA family protein [Desulfobacterales bacterium]|jgi:MinD-like ATPase involved in chromosome partitioning or flagellar assembly|nr:MinD/ParA family protein [Desulfobacteraceae bacterium]MBT4363080.1 MinD/ParA family protein [Desulfobacteraceae bacterium]MBT7084709.1 MinD/ParA family protein [Desulfobacterales bacterium]MBT7697465.1 MinD/ParA family protein [Desulfobacterales bacterium]